MSVSSTKHLDRLNAILYRRPAGRNIIGFAIDEIERLRAENKAMRDLLLDMRQHQGRMQHFTFSAPAASPTL